MNNKRWLVVSVMILSVLNCSQSLSEHQANIGEEFLLTEHQQIRINETDLTIEAVQIIDGLDGSQEIGVGSVYLSVTGGDEQDIEIYLETGNCKMVGEHEILYIEVSSDQDGLKARLVVR